MSLRYRLDDLGWFQFEELCQTLLKTTLGVGIEAWGGRSDIGRDAYYDGPLCLAADVKTPGPFVFQAKFVQGANAAGAKPASALKKALVAECETIKLREKYWDKQVGQYIILTNVPVSSTLRRTASALIKDALPLWSSSIWGASDICRMLDSAPHVRIAYPQILGIRDIWDLLTSVVSKPTIERSRRAIEAAASVSQVFVPTQAYHKALGVLKRSNLVVLSGPPEMGKTTIARIIGLGKLGQGWQFRQCAAPEEILREIDGKDRQVFMADDAFGTSEFRPELARDWEANLDTVVGRLDARHWLLLTSRSAPLKAALRRMHLQGELRDFPAPSEVIVEASQLSRKEKALILYRHSKGAELTTLQKQIVKRYASRIVSHVHFTPERIRRFVKERLSTLDRQSFDPEELDEMIEEAIGRPTEAMRKSFLALDQSHRLALVAMVDASSGLATREAVYEAYDRLANDDSHPCREVVDELLDHFLAET